MEYTPEDFQKELIALLCKAEDMGLDINAVCETTKQTAETFGDGK
jgi:hypothetical protein